MGDMQGTELASLLPHGTLGVCHLPGGKGKSRGAEGAALGAVRSPAERARGDPARCAPAPGQSHAPTAPPAPLGPWDTHGGATTGTMAPQGSGRARCACPHAGDTQHVSPCRAPESARAGEAAAGRDAPQVPGGLTGTQGGIPTVLGSLQGPRRATETLPSPTQPWGYRGAPARAGNPDTPCPASSPGCQETVEALRAQLKSFQERMKRVEESLLSRDYKKHIEV